MWLEPPVALPAVPEPPPHESGLLRVVLGLALALILAVAAAHPMVRKIERRLGLTVILSSGLPFLAMGVFFHDARIGILTDSIVSDLRPALEFGLGWLGFVVGLQFDVREIDVLPQKTGAVVVAESAIPFFTSAIAVFAALVGLHFIGGYDSTLPFSGQLRASFASDELRDALALGACAAPAAPVAAIAIARGSGSVAASIVARVTALNDVAGVVVLGLVCAFFRPTDAVAAWKLPHIAWLFVTLGMGGVLGILTYVLVRSARTQPEEVAYLLGAIALSAGMSGYLGISPLVSCAIAGALLANLPHKSRGAVGAQAEERFMQLKATIAEVERPLYLIFLLIAGALWDPTRLTGWLLMPVFVGARLSGKIFGAFAAKATGPKELPDATTLGLALSPQSPIAIATIVSYLTLYRDEGSPLGASLMTACIGGAVVTELGVQAIARIRGGLPMDARLSYSSIRPMPVPGSGHPSSGYVGVRVPPPAAVPTIPDDPPRPRIPTNPGVGGG